MHIRSILAGGLLTLACGLPAFGASFNFDVLYFGGGVTSLAPGSDNPTGQVVNPGDDFLWSLTAQEGAFWRVENGGNAFFLMAFLVFGDGTRTGDAVLTLSNDGVDVLTSTELDVQNSFVHLGSNITSLTTGLVFDKLSLSYIMKASDVADTTIQGPLPIFGPPEDNTINGVEISYNVVPEPGSFALALLGGAGFFTLARRVGAPRSVS